MHGDWSEGRSGGCAVRVDGRVWWGGGMEWECGGVGELWKRVGAGG